MAAELGTGEREKGQEEYELLMKHPYFATIFGFKCHTAPLPDKYVQVCKSMQLYARRLVPVRDYVEITSGFEVAGYSRLGACVADCMSCRRGGRGSVITKRREKMKRVPRVAGGSWSRGE